MGELSALNMRKPRNTPRRAWAALQAETRARRQEAAAIFREAWERKLTLGRYIGEQSRQLVEELLRDVEGT